MRVKRYVVDSMPDALSRIRSDLGKDAVILNTKQISSGGFFGLFGRKRIEVIAAIDSSPPPAAERPVAAPVPPVKPVIQSAIAHAQGSVAVSSPPQLPHSITEAEKRSAHVEDVLLEEVKQLKNIVFKLASNRDEQPAAPGAFGLLAQQLAKHDLHSSLISTIVHNAVAKTARPGDATEAEAKRLVRSELIDILNSCSVEGLSASCKVAHFVGPTGVGKTTTIAKLAAEQVLKHGRKVGFITSDTYRIAAIEQLKTYANILNVPIEVVFSPHELTKAFRQLEDRDIIFMDTAGRNYRNEMYVSELNSLLRAEAPSETYLVLSMTTKYSDMKAIAHNFSKFKLEKVLFTKTDETESFGSIFNLAHDFGLKMSYITNGQNVPDDISELNGELLADLMMEGQGDE